MLFQSVSGVCPHLEVSMARRGASTGLPQLHPSCILSPTPALTTLDCNWLLVCLSTVNNGSLNSCSAEISL